MFADIAEIIRAIAFVFDDRVAGRFNVNAVFFRSENNCTEFVFADFLEFFNIAALVITQAATDDFLFNFAFKVFQVHLFISSS